MVLCNLGYRLRPISGLNLHLKLTLMLKGTKLYGIAKMRCPKCQEGRFFKGHPYKFSTMGEVNKTCSKCHQKFELETGFYQGSYYVSYALGVALFISIAVLNYIIRGKITPIFLMISFLAVLFVLLPLLYALSKIIWANFFIHYNKNALHNKNKTES